MKSFQLFTSLNWNFYLSTFSTFILESSLINPTLSFSCTHFNHKGELEVLNRKYDALLIEVLSTKDTVGLMRLDSKIKVEKVER